MYSGSRAAILGHFALMAACLFAAGCSSAPLEGSHASPEALAQAVLDSVERRDLDALSTLALNEAEFREEVWPELPAARPERGLPFSYVWGDLHQKSAAALQQSLSVHGGKGYMLKAVNFSGGTTQYKTYLVHRESALIVTDADGRERELGLFGSVLEKDGRFKVFSYVIE
jgi:hypothetical protein